MNPVELLAPISSEAPAGVDVRYGAAHTAIRAEVHKGEALQGEEPDWSLVVKEGEQLVQHHSKDLLIACYLAVASYETRRGEGLADGLEVVAGLLDQYWEDLFPIRKRSRARAEAVRWLTEQLERRFESSSLKLADSVRIRCEQAMSEINRSLVGHLGEDAPATASLLRLLKAEARVVAETPDETGVAADTSRQPSAADAASSDPTHASTAVASDSVTLLEETPSASDPEQLLAVTGRHLISLALQIRKVIPQDPAPYRLLRAGIDVPLQSAPIAIDGRTQLQAPPKPLREQLATLAQNQKWAALLDEAESALVQWRCWLTPHRLSVTALRGLGMETAACAVEDGVSSLLRRLPELRHLRFADGTALADDATLEWLATLSRDSSSQLSKRGAEPTSSQTASEEEPSATGAGRARFQARLDLAVACASAGKSVAARSLYDGLVEESSERGLASWDPSLVGDALSGYLRCIADSTDPQDGPLRRRLQSELSKVDPGRWVCMSAPGVNGAG